MTWRFWNRKPTQAEVVAAASRWFDEDRKRRMAAINTAHSRASKKGWETRRAKA